MHLASGTCKKKIGYEKKELESKDGSDLQAGSFSSAVRTGAAG